MQMFCVQTVVNYFSHTSIAIIRITHLKQCTLCMEHNCKVQEFIMYLRVIWCRVIECISHAIVLVTTTTING